jgi:hypothetical protein
MHQPEKRIDPVVVQVKAFPQSWLQHQLLLRSVAVDLVTAARFHTSQDADQTLADTVPLGNLPRHVFLACLRRGQIDDRTLQTPGRLARSLLQPFRSLLDVASEVLQKHPHAAQEAHHSHRKGQTPQGSSQHEPIKSTQHTNGVPFVLLDKMVHGVLLG